jgi:hypothetical protein
LTCEHSVLSQELLVTGLMCGDPFGILWSPCEAFWRWLSRTLLCERKLPGTGGERGEGALFCCDSCSDVTSVLDSQFQLGGSFLSPAGLTTWSLLLHL